MIPVTERWHRWGLAALLFGNAIAFAGVDPPTRAISAVLLVALALDLPRAEVAMPRTFRIAAAILFGLVVVQLIPLPAGPREFLQPGLEGLTSPGWFTLSVAPWATLETASMWCLALVAALVAARMASTRSGLPQLLWTIALTGGVLALLGLGTESGLPGRVLLVRENTSGGGPYGPFVNANHFAVAMELTIPAAIALLAVAARHLPHLGAARRQASTAFLAAATLTALAAAALLRSQSRGGALVLLAAALLTLPLWRRRRPGRRWPWTVAIVILLAGVTVLAWTRLPALADDFRQLVAIQGVEGNDRWDLWHGTLSLWGRAPVVGVGLGAYRNAAGLDSPPTGAAVLEQAHNDWLEWGATTGIVGAAALLLGVGWLIWSFRPGRVRGFRFEIRYALAAAALALGATALHETIGFALQTPLNRFLASLWVGLAWGLATRDRPRSTPAETQEEESEE